MTSHARFAVLLAALICGAGTASAQAPTVEEAREILGQVAEKKRLQRADMSFEEFMASVYREPGPNGKFIVSGDVTIANEKQLREFFERNVKNKPPEPPEHSENVLELIVHQVGGLDALWSDGEKRRLTYCVSTGFGSRHAAVVAAMADAAGAWEAVADIDFLHLSGEDGACDAANAAVMFDTRPVDFGEYLARAFFPPEARPTRNVLIDQSSFELDPNDTLTLTGILRHELGHVLGFRHEHTRPDSGTCFEDVEWREITDYDALSTMHYPQCNGLGDWSLRLTDFDKHGAACVYGPSPGFVIDTSICQGEAARARSEVFEDQFVAEGEDVRFGPFEAAAQTSFVAEMRGGGDAAGDPDLYVKFDALANTAEFDCRPFLDGADEVCAVDVPADHQAASVMVRGFKAGNFDLTVTYTASD